MFNFINKPFSLVFVLFFLTSLTTFAQKAGVITMVQGPVEIFVKPSLEPTGEPPRVKFEDKFFTIKDAKIGYALKFNEVIKTGPTSKVKINFVNGDSMVLAPGTALNLSDLKEQLSDKTQKGQVLNLIYGKVRAVISKTGPRNNLEVKTKTAVAGVRGTDFFVVFNPAEDSTRVDVIRGKVQMQDHTKAPPKIVSKGFSLKLKANESPEAVSEIKFKPISKEKLLEIQSETKLEESTQVLAEQPQEVKELVQKLDEKNKETILEDIKKEEPEKYEQIVASSKTLSTEAINNFVVTEMKKSAPTEPEIDKISEQDLIKSLQDQTDAYKKYFK